MQHTPPALAKALDNIDVRSSRRDAHSVLDAINQAIKAHNIEETDGPTLWEVYAFSFRVTRPSGTNRSRPHFAPMWSSLGDDGKLHQHPDTSRVTADTVAFWATRADASKSPFFRSRYSDLVWDFAPVAKWRGNRGHYGRRAIDGYFDLAKDGGLTSPILVYDYLRRAIELAILLSDKERIATGRDLLLSAEAKHAVIGQLGTWGVCFKTLIDSKRIPLSPDQEDQIIRQLEDFLSKAGDSTQPLFDPFAVQHAADMLLVYYSRRQRKDDLCRVLFAYRDAFIASARKPSEFAINSMARLARVHHLFEKYAVADGVDELEELMRAFGELANDELGQFAHKIEHTVEEVDQVISAIVADSLPASCYRIARVFAPSVPEARKTLEEIKDDAPAFGLLPMSMMESHGRTGAAVGGIDSDQEGRLMQHLAQIARFNTMWLDLSMRRLFDKFVSTPAALVGWLIGCPLFRPLDERTLQSSVTAYMRGEYALTVCALVPLIESAIRELARHRGASLLRKGRFHGQHLRNLDELLTDEKVRGYYPEQFSIYLRMLLTDQRGWNVRNNVCHGIIPGDQIGVSYANRVLHSLFIVALARPRDEEIEKAIL
jgi:hypothetical protein